MDTGICALNLNINFSKDILGNLLVPVFSWGADDLPIFLNFLSGHATVLGLQTFRHCIFNLCTTAQFFL